MSEWNPIETAPKDGAEVLLYTRSGIAIGVWENLEEDSPDQPGHDPGWIGYGHYCDHISWGRTRKYGFTGSQFIYEAENQPTHWMPLPAPPTE